MNPDDRILGAATVRQAWMNVLELQARISGEEVRRILIEHPSGVGVLLYDPRRKVALTLRQTRLPVLYLGKPALAEAVAGVAEDETAEETARREAFEETGLEVKAIEEVGHVWMTPSSTTERVHLFLAEYGSSSAIGPGPGADGEVEELEVQEEPLEVLWAHAQSGQLTDAKLFMLLQALRIRRPELFA